MHVVPLPALADNYIWLLHEAGNAVVVDPGDASVVEDALTALQLRLRAVLLTHHHPDHIGGARALRERHAAPIYAPCDERITETTHELADGDVVDLAAPQLHFEVIALPGHTRSHIAYVGNGLLLSGDTLFSLGCGRLFEGTPEQMLHSLDRLARLPEETLLCAGHEYTAANGRFARMVDPHNAALLERIEQVATLRTRQQPTLPVSLASERATNPFLRVDADPVSQWCESHGSRPRDRVGRFAVLRHAKDEFRA